MPDNSEIFPLIDIFPSIAVPVDLFIVKLLNGVAETVCVPAPFRVIVPVDGVKVPELLQFPPIVFVTLPLTNIAPEAMDTLPVIVDAALISSSPAVMVRFPLMVVALLIVAIPVLLITRF